MKVLVFCEQRDAKLKSNVFELLSAARRLAGSSAEVCALVVGENISSLTAELKGWGCDTVLVADHSDLGIYNVLSYAQAFASAVTEFAPELVLGIASPMGRDLFPRLAARFKAPLLTDLLAIDAEGKSATKPMYAGKILAESCFTTDALRFATLRPNVFAAEASEGAANPKPLAFAGSSDNPLKTLKITKLASQEADLTEASSIVSGGRSLGSADNFAILRECAQVIGASVGASRAAVDSGYASHDMQVGQTGKTVNPSLYVACGISGSIQHLAGMRTAKTIVAINTDPDAPIFSVASYGIVADLFEAVPILTQKLGKIVED